MIDHYDFMIMTELSIIEYSNKNHKKDGNVRNVLMPKS